MHRPDTGKLHRRNGRGGKSETSDIKGDLSGFSWSYSVRSPPDQSRAHKRCSI